jgi:N-acetylneuraminic acid mutarotase
MKGLSFSCLPFQGLIVATNRSLKAKKQRVVSVIYAAITTAVCLFPANAQTNEWTWMGGTKTPALATFGTLGVPSASNFPSNRHAAVNWTDSQGNLWMFGGDGFDASGKPGYLNDLWEYNPSTNEWTWMGGSNNASNFGTAEGVAGTLGTPSTQNIPQGRFGAIGWTDQDGNLWLFGGNNYTGKFNYYNDLWRYNPSTKEWTWMSGVNAESCTNCTQSGVYGSQGVAAPGNTPGSRMNTVSWTDKNGNLWLFGGYGLDSAGTLGDLNDLWRYSPSTNQWTWIAGSTTVVCTNRCGRFGVYGTKGIAAAANLPGSREQASAWTDSNGSFWLFGGLGADSAGTYGLLNDLWKFDPNTNEWTWISGADTYPSSCTTPLLGQCGAAGIYGTLQVPSASNSPGARTLGAGWADGNGNLWLFGGDGIDSVNKWGYLNDLWEYSTSTNRWTWMGGSNTVSCFSTYCGQPGVYGTLGTPGMTNVPSGRDDMAKWVDNKGNLWLFGGSGVNVTGTWNYFQDLWRFQPNSNNLPLAATPTFSPTPGTFTSIQTVTIEDTTPGSTIYYTINGNTSVFQYTGPIPVTSSQTIQAIAVADGYATSLLANAAYTIQVTPAPSPTFNPSSGTYASGQTVSLSDAVSGATIYYTTDRSVPTVNSAVYTSPITVSSSGVVRAIAAADHYSNSAISSAVYTIGSTDASGQWAWIAGSRAANQSGVYGTLQTPATGNSPGARDGAVSWTDSRGNFWLFGGKGYDSTGNQGYLNDLWMFNPSTQLWSWMGGSNAIPCFVNLGVKTCTGAPNVYGTLGTPAAGNTPGARTGATAWTDNSGKLWLFGGFGVGTWGGPYGALATSPGEANDLWRYDPATNQWTWMGGTNLVGEAGKYGGLGIPGSSNVPGGRYNAASWVDHDGNVWLFGGTGRDGGDFVVTLNDFWKFNPAAMQWTWMGGSELVGPLLTSQNANYGTLGVPAAENIPGSRAGAAAWTDKDGNLWLFGGVGSTSKGNLNDLWRYNISTQQWTWMAGADTPYCPYDPFVGLNSCSSQPAVYGVLGVPAANNTPSGGSGFAEWTDQQGNFWLLGGSGSDITGQDDGFHLGLTNALWVFNPSINQWSWMGGDYAASNCSFQIIIPIPFVVCDGAQGFSAGQGVFDVGNAPSARSGAVSWTDKSGNLWLFSGAGTDLSSTPIRTSDLWEYQPSTVTFPPAATPIFSLVPGVYTASGQITMSNGMPNATIYYTTDGTSPTPSSSRYTGPITLSSSQTIQAIATAPGYRNSGLQRANYILPTSLSAPVFSVPSGTYTTIQTVAVSSPSPGATITYNTYVSGVQSGSFTYTGPITLSSSVSLRAIAVATGYFVLDGIAANYGPTIVSPQSSADYTINLPQATAPTFNLASGHYTTPQALVITDTTPGAVIYYTTDGTAPTLMSNVYSSPISISTSTTVQAMAVATGYKSSSVSSVALVFPPAATPTFSVPSGTYTSVQTVTISDTTPSATIYYTTNGTKPTTSSTVYTGPITVSSSQTIQAIATASGYSISPVASVQYTVNLPPADFSVTASSSSLVIEAGQSSSFSLTLTPLNGFNSVVSFSCSGLPAGASCSFSPATVTPNGGPITTTVTVNTSPTAAVRKFGEGSLAPIFLAMTFGWFRRRGSRLRTQVLLLLCAVSSLMLSGCGGGGSAPSSGRQPATVTLVATAGAVQRTTTVSLTVE